MTPLFKLFGNCKQTVTRAKDANLKQRRTLRLETLQSRITLNADAPDLSVLNDEFEDAGSLTDWQLISETEGWQSQHFETFDVNQTTPGQLTIAPQTSTWYQDYQGDLAYKEIAGDFEVTTRVSVRDRDDIGDSDDDHVPNGSTFSLGGIMLRSPTELTDAPNQWQSGNANFVFLSLGHGINGSMSFESKNTINSNSALELIPAEGSTAELLIRREGSTISTFYRYEAEGQWQQAAEFERPDMPETLQVGLVGYSDYGKTSTFSPEYFNNNTLVDTPENAAASSNPAVPYNPDLQASFDYIRFQRLGLSTVEVELAVVNPGFEDISGESTVGEFTFGPLAGWDLFDPDGTTNGGAGPQFYIGTLQPSEYDGEMQYFPGGASEGARVGIAFNFAGSEDLGEYGLQQVLDATLSPNSSYSLSVDIGNIATGISTNGQEFLLGGFPGYRVDLMAGDTVLASDNNSLDGEIPEGEFRTSTVEFQSGAEHPQLGEPLRIRLVNLNLSSDVPGGHDLEVDFDNVRLSATLPAFGVIGTQEVDHLEVLNVELPASLPGGSEIDYSVAVLNDYWFELDGDIDLSVNAYDTEGNPLYYEGYSDFGFKWLRSGDGGWMYLNASGDLYDWQGTVASSPLVADLDEFVFSDPSLLHDAVLGGAAEIQDDVLTLDPLNGFDGSYFVALEKSAAGANEREVIEVVVANDGLTIPEVEDQVASSGSAVLVELPAQTESGLEISYDLEIVENIAANIREEFGIVASADLVAGDYGYNFLGNGERWVQSNVGWMFLTEVGTLHQWTGSYANSPEIAQLDTRFHADPGLLVEAIEVAVTFSYSDGQLEIQLPTGWTGTLNIRLSAGDGVNEHEQDFFLQVSPV
ncbi:MAG: hypothetical protein AAF483_19085 [Planctomycetota bacterium]